MGVGRAVLELRLDIEVKVVLKNSKGNVCTHQLCPLSVESRTLLKYSSLLVSISLLIVPHSSGL